MPSAFRHFCCKVSVMKKHRGYTLKELLVVIFTLCFGLTILVINAALIYAAYHFITKYW